MAKARTIVALNAVSATTTSGTIALNEGNISSVQFIATGISTGNGVFIIEVSNDGTNWTTYNRITSNATNTNAQTDVRVASVTLSTNTNAIAFAPVGDRFSFMRVKVTRTTDGVYSAVVFIS